MFLEECKYVVTHGKIPKYIIDDIEISFDSDRENSGEKNLKNTNITHSLKLIFEVYKKNFTDFFRYIKMVNNE